MFRLNPSHHAARLSSKFSATLCLIRAGFKLQSIRLSSYNLQIVQCTGQATISSQSQQLTNGRLQVVGEVETLLLQRLNLLSVPNIDYSETTRPCIAMQERTTAQKEGSISQICQLIPELLISPVQTTSIHHIHCVAA